MHLSGSIRRVFDELAAIADWFTRHADLAKFVFGFAGGMVPGIIAGSAIAPGPGTVIGGVTTGLIGGLASVMSDGWSSKGASNGVTPNQAKAMAYEAATRHGLDPAVFMGMIEKESSWNPLAKNPHSTASGLGQLLRGTAADMHVGNVFDPYQNLEGSASYLAKLLNQSGNYANALAAYGEGPSYAADILNNRRHHYDSYQPASSNSKVSFGDTNIYVTQPNASAEDIANKTVAKQREMLSQGTQRNLVELSGSYA
jgi:hypothetical protein